MSKTRLTKKEKIRKIMEANQESASILRNFNLNDIKPLTENQSLTFEAYEKGKHLMLHGVPGSGKTFVAMFLALRDILSGKTQYDKMVIVRSVVPTRDQGFQPGTKAEKEAVYESPYYINCSELFNRGDAYSYLKKREIIQFISTSFIRGITINNSVIIVDEMQNMTAAELNTVITRTGKNCRLIFCGDIAQTDLLNPKKEKTGLGDFIKIIDSMNKFEFIEFEENDIVRSGLVKDYIITRMNLEKIGKIETLTSL